MKFLLAVVVSLTLAACASNPADTDATPFVQVTDIASEGIFGKRLKLDDNYIVLSEDGTVNGMWAGGPAVGTWEMRDGLWCRTYTEFSLPDFVNDEKCHSWKRKGDTIKAKRDNGSGSTYTLTILE